MVSVGFVDMKQSENTMDKRHFSTQFSLEISVHGSTNKNIFIIFNFTLFLDRAIHNRVSWQLVKLKDKFIPCVVLFSTSCVSLEAQLERIWGEF